MDLLFLYNLIALRAMDLFPRSFTLVLAPSKNASKACDAFAASRITVSGEPRRLQIDSGGDWKHEVWTDLCSGGHIRLQFQGKGAHPRMSERRDGLAHGTLHRLLGGGRPVDRAT